MGCASNWRFVLFNAMCLTQPQQYGITTKKRFLLLVLPRYLSVCSTTSVSCTRFLMSFASLLLSQTWVCWACRSLSYPVRWHDIALSTPCTAQQCSIYVSYFVTTEFVSLEDEQSAPTRDVLELGDMSCPIRLSHSSTAAWDFANNKCYHLRFYTRFLMFFSSLLPPQTLVLCLS